MFFKILGIFGVGRFSPQRRPNSLGSRADREAPPVVFAKSIIILRSGRAAVRKLELRISNAQPHRTGRLLLRLLKSLLDPADHSFRGLDLFAVLFKTGNPDVDKFVAKQLIRGER